MEPPATATLATEIAPDGTLVLALRGPLNSQTISSLWRESLQKLAQSPARKVRVDASAVTYCDGTGVALLVNLLRRQYQEGLAISVDGLAEEYQRLLDFFDPAEFKEARKQKLVPVHFPEEIGRTVVNLGQDLYSLVSFIGELAAALAHAVRHPQGLRWRDVLWTAEQAGVNGLPITALISFLFGLIMAFQAAIPMRQFGVEIYVANLVALTMLRELGPLMTAILLAGRSGSAFAAEIGTMKVNEEINALTTMGLDPVRFLVVTRVLAAVAMMPLLTLFANFMGLVGGLVVFLSFGFPFVAYVQQVQSAVTMTDLLGGLAKALVFGILVAGIGCLRGLQTRTGASSVGISTTRAVVSGIVLIVVTDGIFAVLFYYLGI